MKAGNKKGSVKKIKEFDQLTREHFFPHKYSLVVKNKGDKILREIPKGSLVLNAGCGAGYLNRMALDRGLKVVAVDVADKVIAENRFINRKFGYKMKLVKASVYKLPFKKENFDAVVLTEVLEHLENPRQALKELSRVLKKNGLFFLTVPGYSYGLIFDRFISRIMPGHYDKKVSRSFKDLGLDHRTEDSDAHLHQFGLGQLKNFLQKSGFSVVKASNNAVFYPFVAGLLSGILGVRRDKLQQLEKLDLFLADRLPMFLGSGWLFICRKK